MLSRITERQKRTAASTSALDVGSGDIICLLLTTIQWMSRPTAKPPALSRC